MKLSYKHFEAIGSGEKVPRKVKKAIVGIRISNSELQRKIKRFHLVEAATTMYERPVFSEESFCPKCGCVHYSGTGNMTEYPEHWEYFYCLRCHYKVGWIDNSPFIHVLEEVLYDMYNVD